MPYTTAPTRHLSNLVRGLPIPTLAALLALTTACDQPETAADGIFTPELTDSAILPPSEHEAVAVLADERTACVVDSYEVQIRCLAREGAVVGVFGRQGEGPGEFDSPAYLARGDEGTVGVMDLGLNRFTIFEPSGTHVSDVTTPGGVFSPLRSFGDVLSGVSPDLMAMLAGESSYPRMNRYELNIATGEVLRDVESPPGPWDVECGDVIDGIPDRGNGWILLACEAHLIFVGDTGEATVLRAPAYVPELPSEEEVAEREEELMAFNRDLGLPADMNLAEPMERFRTTPKNYHLSTAAQLVDADNRYWIATQRDLREWSYLDVYENAEYVGSVKVRDRMRGFDLVGSTLVVLVDRQLGADDADGVPDRALDWYDIGEFE